VLLRPMGLVNGSRKLQSPVTADLPGLLRCSGGDVGRIDSRRRPAPEVFKPRRRNGGAGGPLLGPLLADLRNRGGTRSHNSPRSIWAWRIEFCAGTRRWDPAVEARAASAKTRCRPAKMAVGEEDRERPYSGHDESPTATICRRELLERSGRFAVVSGAFIHGASPDDGRFWRKGKKNNIQNAFGVAQKKYGIGNGGGPTGDANAAWFAHALVGFSADGARYKKLTFGASFMAQGHGDKSLKLLCSETAAPSSG